MGIIQILIRSLLLFITIMLTGCNSPQKKESQDKIKHMETYEKGTFGYDYQFLASKQDAILLHDSTKQSLVLLSPAWQGRVMTSSAGGMKGFSYGWINYDLIESGKVLKHMNAFGGEERFWLGPEGGKFSIYFQKGEDFVFENWQVPKEIDTEPFEIIQKNNQKAIFSKKMRLRNYVGTYLLLEVNRKVNILSREKINSCLDIALSDNIKTVAYQSDNTITNLNDFSWDEKTGMVCIWMLCMFNPSPEVTVVIPLQETTSDLTQPIVSDEYFGKVPSDRLVIKNGTVFFKADGKKRGKIGLSPENAGRFLGSYDKRNKILTVLEYEKPKGKNKYLKSSWELHDDPFSGDIINSYNDGPLEDGSQMGPFYELESSSPAAFLEPGESQQHVQRIYHFEGQEHQLDMISRKIFQVSLQEISAVF